MKFWDKVRGRLAAKQEKHEREAQEDLDAANRGEISDLPSHKREVRLERGQEGYPSAGGGITPPP